MWPCPDKSTRLKQGDQPVSGPGSTPAAAATVAVRVGGDSGMKELSTVRLVALLAGVTAVQAIATFSVLALPTLATRAAPHYGVGAEAVGYQISIIYVAAATLSGVAGHFVKRYGAALSSIWAIALSAIGIAGLASGYIVAAVLGSAAIGCAYGLTNPSASHLLLRFGPARWQNLVFALKQTGVPLGGVLAALMLPRLSERVGWQGALLASLVLHAVLAVGLGLCRRWLDDDRSPVARLSGSVLAGVRFVLADRLLLALALMGFAYAFYQFCLFAFLITMLVQDFHWSLVAAGSMATMMQVGGVVGRLAWSLLADRIGRGQQILVAIGVFSAACGLALGFAGPAWPTWLLTLVLFYFGFCLVGWNGLWMAEIARASGREHVGLATGGVLVFTFSGVVAGPALFATAYRALGSYAATYAAFSGLAVAGAVLLAWAIMRQRRSRPA